MWQKKNVYLLLLIILVLGVMLGSLYSNIIDLKISDVFLSFFGVYLQKEIVKNASIICLFIKYGFTLLLIYIVSYHSFGIYLTMSLLLIVGFFYGYTVSELFIGYYLWGLWLFANRYVLQTILFIALVFRMAYVSIQHFVFTKGSFTGLRIDNNYKKTVVCVKELIIVEIGAGSILLIEFFRFL